jgi:hypothetical protein
VQFRGMSVAYWGRWRYYLDIHSPSARLPIGDKLVKLALYPAALLAALAGVSACSPETPTAPISVEAGQEQRAETIAWEDDDPPALSEADSADVTSSGVGTLGSGN